jgi:hypothetical protein
MGTEIVKRETMEAMGQSCTECGGLNGKGKLFVYYTIRVAARPFSSRRTHNGAFCSKKCHDAYNGR